MKIFLSFAVVAIIAVLACFALGAFDGDGVVTVDNKDFMEFTFSGDLRDGLFHGYGSVNFNDGERFSGEFYGGRFDGQGAFYSANDEWNLYGVFLSGELNIGKLNTDHGRAVTLERDAGSATLTGEAWLFDGSVNDHGQIGEGTFVFADGSVYTGSFLNGLADGEGTLMDSSGRIIYEGGFKEGLLDGQGRYYSLEGWSYEGGFRFGIFHGEGVVNIAGEAIRGVWEMGVQISRYE